MFWKKFPKRKPKKDGWYLTTIRFKQGKGFQTYVMNLYWYGKRNQGEGAFIDNIRQNVFECYYVKMSEYSDERLKTIRLCDRTNQVIAWRKLPKPYKFYEKGNIEREKYETNNEYNS